MNLKRLSAPELIKRIQKEKHNLVERKAYVRPGRLPTRRTNAFNNKQVKKGKDVPSLIIEGHRGVGLFEAHNSMSSFQKSIDMKLDFIELDTWLTSDSVVIVVHGVDGKVKKVNGEMTAIGEITAAEASEIVLNEKGDTIPTLKQVLSFCRDRIKVNIELKSEDTALPLAVMRVVNEEKMLEQVYVSSFFHPFEPLVRSAEKELGMYPRVKFAYLFSKPEQFPALSMILPGDQLNFSSVLSYDEAAINLIVAAREKGATLSCYFGYDLLEHEGIYKRLIQLGCCSIITNQPSTLLQFRTKYALL